MSPLSPGSSAKAPANSAFVHLLHQRKLSPESVNQQCSALLYGLLSASGSTVVGVSHHPALEAYHTQVLELRAEGAWRMRGARRHQLEEVEFVA